jgi:hypothetical protein
VSQLRTVNVNNANPADLLVAAGDSPTLIGNKDITTSLWISRSVAVIGGLPTESIEITPQSWVVVDGEEDIYGITTGLTIQVNLIPGGLSFFQSGITGGGFIADPTGAYFYAGTPGPNTLICAITGTNASGTDKYGNAYTPGGMCIIAQPAATSLFSVTDAAIPPSLLASISGDGSFSTEGALNAGTDLTVGGSSVVNDLLPPMAQGLLARTSVLASSLPAPASPVTGEFFLYELDVDYPSGGREILLVIEPIQVVFSGAGKCRITIYGTHDGSQVTNASPVLIASDFIANVTANFAMRMNPVYHTLSPAAGTTGRYLVSLTTLGTGGTNPTIQMQQLDFAPTGGDGYSGANARFSIYDMGATVANTGRPILTGGSSGSGGGTKNYTKTYTCTASHCYEGSDGTFPNTKINDGGNATQGGDRPNTFNGRAKTWYEFNTAAIQADLAGATITAFKVYLNNNHSWFNSGITAAIGYDTKTGFSASEGDPAGPGIDAVESHFNEGQAKWVDLSGAGFGTSFQTVRTQIVLFKNSNNLQYYGFFAGRNQNGPCQIKISYTK